MSKADNRRDDIIRIAFVGRMRSGKSSAASHLETAHGFRTVSFGTALRRVAYELFDGTTVEAYRTEYTYDTCPFTGGQIVIGKRKPRRLLQDVGQALRELDEDVWVRQLAVTVGVYESLYVTNGIVIDDLRQPNEYEWAKDNGFTIIRVNANEDTRLARARAAGDDFTTDDLRHETELHVDDFEADYDIWNDDDVGRDELERKIDEIVDEIKTKGGR